MNEKKRRKKKLREQQKEKRQTSHVYSSNSGLINPLLLLIHLVINLQINFFCKYFFFLTSIEFLSRIEPINSTRKREKKDDHHFEIKIEMMCACQMQWMRSRTISSFFFFFIVNNANLFPDVSLVFFYSK
jgi:hypothetical protein